jgi:large subunit ribosomal protein L17
MRHLVEGRKLNRSASHRRAMLSNMAVSILDKERITTTLPKAKEVRRVVERLITYGKMGTLHGIRLAERRIKDKTILKKLFDDIAPSYKERVGGYTRIIRLGERKGDNAAMSIIELTGRGHPDAVRKGKKKSKVKKSPVIAGEKTTAAEQPKTVDVQNEAKDAGNETDVKTTKTAKPKKAAKITKATKEAAEPAVTTEPTDAKDAKAS